MEKESNYGQAVRLFLRDLFGSRVSSTLEYQIDRTRADYEARLADKDEIIADLRSRVAAQSMKLELWEKVLIPLTSPASKLLNPNRPAPVFEPLLESGWAAVQAEWRRSQVAQETKSDEGIPEQVS